jgi:hypothetical protein
MKIKLLITTDNDTSVSQDIISEWSVDKHGMEFFTKLQQYMNTYIMEYNTKNTIHIKCLESFDDDGVLLMRMDKNQ